MASPGRRAAGSPAKSRGSVTYSRGSGMNSMNTTNTPSSPPSSPMRRSSIQSRGSIVNTSFSRSTRYSPGPSVVRSVAVAEESALDPNGPVSARFRRFAVVGDFSEIKRGRNSILGGASFPNGRRVSRSDNPNMPLQRRKTSFMAMPASVRDEAFLPPELETDEAHEVPDLSLLVQDSFQTDPTLRTVEMVHALSEWLRSFWYFMKVPMEDINKVAASIKYVRKRPGDVVTRQAMEEGTCVYVILKGVCSVHIETEAAEFYNVKNVVQCKGVAMAKDNSDVERALEEVFGAQVQVMRRGCVFGEIAASKDLRRTATCIMRSKSELLVIDRDDYNNYVVPFVNPSDLPYRCRALLHLPAAQRSPQDRYLLAELVMWHKYFRSMRRSVLLQCCGVVQHHCIPSGMLITKEAHTGKHFYIILSGCVQVYQVDEAKREDGAGALKAAEAAPSPPGKGAGAGLLQGARAVRGVSQVLLAGAKFVGSRGADRGVKTPSLLSRGGPGTAGFEYKSLDEFLQAELDAREKEEAAQEERRAGMTKEALKQHHEQQLLDKFALLNSETVDMRYQYEQWTDDMFPADKDRYGRHVRKLTPGESFGQKALEPDGDGENLRTATCFASGNTELLSLDQDNFLRFVQAESQHKEETDVDLQELLELEPREREAAVVAQIVDEIRNHFFFRKFDTQTLRQLAAGASFLRAEGEDGGEVLFAQGDPAQLVYVVLKGSVAVHRLERGSHPPPGRKAGERVGSARALEYGPCIRVLGVGECFGEVGVLRQGPRTASVITRGPCEFFCLSPDLYSIIADPGISLLTEKVDLLRCLFNTCSHMELTRVAQCLKEVSADARHPIIQEGEAVAALYVVRSGWCTASRRMPVPTTLEEPGKAPRLEDVTLAEFGAGEMFGDYQVSHKAPSPFTVSASSGAVSLFRAGAGEFMAHLPAHMHADLEELAASKLRWLQEHEAEVRRRREAAHDRPEDAPSRSKPHRPTTLTPRKFQGPGTVAGAALTAAQLDEMRQQLVATSGHSLAPEGAGAPRPRKASPRALALALPAGPPPASAPSSPLRTSSPAPAASPWAAPPPPDRSATPPPYSRPFSPASPPATRPQSMESPRAGAGARPAASPKRPLPVGIGASLPVASPGQSHHQSHHHQSHHRSKAFVSSPHDRARERILKSPHSGRGRAPAGSRPASPAGPLVVHQRDAARGEAMRAFSPYGGLPEDYEGPELELRPGTAPAGPVPPAPSAAWLRLQADHLRDAAEGGEGPYVPFVKEGGEERGRSPIAWLSGPMALAEEQPGAPTIRARAPLVSTLSREGRATEPVSLSVAAAYTKRDKIQASRTHASRVHTTRELIEHLCGVPAFATLDTIKAAEEPPEQVTFHLVEPKLHEAAAAEPPSVPSRVASPESTAEQPAEAPAPPSPPPSQAFDVLMGAISTQATPAGGETSPKVRSGEASTASQPEEPPQPAPPAEPTSPKVSATTSAAAAMLKSPPEEKPPEPDKPAREQLRSPGLKGLDSALAKESHPSQAVEARAGRRLHRMFESDEDEDSLHHDSHRASAASVASEPSSHDDDTDAFTRSIVEDQQHLVSEMKRVSQLADPKGSPQRAAEPDGGSLRKWSARTNDEPTSPTGQKQPRKKKESVAKPAARSPRQGGEAKGRVSHAPSPAAPVWASPTAHPASSYTTTAMDVMEEVENGIILQRHPACHQVMRGADQRTPIGAFLRAPSRQSTTPAGRKEAVSPTSPRTSPWPADMPHPPNAAELYNPLGYPDHYDPGIEAPLQFPDESYPAEAPAFKYAPPEDGTLVWNGTGIKLDTNKVMVTQAQASNVDGGNPNGPYVRTKGFMAPKFRTKNADARRVKFRLSVGGLPGAE